MPELQRPHAAVVLTLLLGTALSCSAVAAADAAPLEATPPLEQTPPLEEIVVSSSRVPLPRKYLATSVSTLDADAIASRGYLNLVSLLRQLPAVSVSSNGGMGQVSSLRIRGEDGFRTLTVLDGIRLSDPGGTQVGPLLEHMNSSGIGRVEVLRGPQGLAWGADAGGVLNLVSPSATQPFSAQLDASRGSYGSTQYHAAVGGRRQRVDYGLMYTRLGTDGFNSLTGDTQRRDDDGYDNRTLHLRTGLALSDAWQLQLVHRDTDATTDYDYCFAASLTHDCRSDYALQASRVALVHETPQQRHSLSLARTRTERRYFADAQPSFATDGELQRVEYQGSQQALPGLALVYGLDLEDAIQGGRGRDNHGGYVEVLADLQERLFLSAGLRHDVNEDFGSNTSERVGIAWLQPLGTQQVLKLRGSAGSGFRAPSPYEIAYNSGPWALPPASTQALQQERSRGWELGADLYRGDAWQLGLTWFDQRIEDAIDFDLAGFSGYLQTPGSSRSKGVELSAGAALAATVRLDANYTWNDTARPDGQPRRYRPEHLANLGLTWTPARLPLQLQGWLRASSTPYDETAPAAAGLAGYTVLDLQVNHTLQRALQLHLRLENALDEQYEEIAGYRTAGRALHVGLRLALGAD